MTSENDFEQSSAQRTVNSYGKMKFLPRTVSVKPLIGFFLDTDNGGALREVRLTVCEGKHPSASSAEVRNMWRISSTLSKVTISINVWH